MTDTLKNIVSMATWGFRDSIVGTLTTWKLDKPREQSDSRRPVSEAETTLARRRAERLRHKEDKKKSEPNVRNRIFLCCAWNGGVCWLSILVFNYFLLPCIYCFTELLVGGEDSHSFIWSWLGPFLSWTFSALWVLPLFMLSKLINCFWFQDIADVAYQTRRGSPRLSSLSFFIADIVFSLLLEALFLMQGLAVSFLPIYGVGQFISLVHLTMLYSLYSFEYKWINMGLGVHQRLSLIEKNWPYFMGFGFPLVLVTSLPSSIVISGCIFSILFPLFIISANEAREPTATFDIALPIFAPVITLSNKLFYTLSGKKMFLARHPRAHLPGEDTLHLVELFMFCLPLCRTDTRYSYCLAPKLSFRLYKYMCNFISHKS
ncbi:etoposide-induced protein 2.4 homolog [Gigantopelta aegis]|uniref:etoposide-induced protein 2.4 homolog n=1 Tax=Gigantopelta aegis TaxID=1735272 RepID=UPI001B88AABD|nr:etoposide-induced protein 2.4 homolog [Gigantopelta aegis]